ncbi:hypothetical protein CC2G_007006 [Coprinopsis cinerea AmutBmut pab1-1]|nr:hypothetical protein CC2G_007006 [Coprinopsis cinerea AmutBmut pab1-1]
MIGGGSFIPWSDLLNSAVGAQHSGSSFQTTFHRRLFGFFTAHRAFFRQPPGPLDFIEVRLNQAEHRGTARILYPFHLSVYEKLHESCLARAPAALSAFAVALYYDDLSDLAPSKC